MRRENVKKALLFGAVPSWFYLAPMALGILSGFGCKAYAPVMVNILGEIGADRHPKMYRTFRFGCAFAPMMFVSFHTACCLAADVPGLLEII